MQLHKARIVQVAYVIHYAGTSAQEHSFTRRAWDKTHQYWLLGWDPLVWIVGLSPIMHWLQFMNYDMCLYYTVKAVRLLILILAEPEDMWYTWYVNCISDDWYDMLYVACDSLAEPRLTDTLMCRYIKRMLTAMSTESWERGIYIRSSGSQAVSFKNNVSWNGQLDGSHISYCKMVS